MNPKCSLPSMSAKAMLLRPRGSDCVTVPVNRDRDSTVESDPRNSKRVFCRKAVDLALWNKAKCLARVVEGGKNRGS
jgi:hypothetical protein